VGPEKNIIIIIILGYTAAIIFELLSPKFTSSQCSPCVLWDLRPRPLTPVLAVFHCLPVRRGLDSKWWYWCGLWKCLLVREIY